MESCLEREFNAFLWFSLIGVTAYLLGRLCKVFSLWSKARHLPGPPCTSFYGHANLFSTATVADILYTFHKKYGEVVKVWMGPTQLMVSIADTELIKEVLLNAEDKLTWTGRGFHLAFGKSSLFISSFEKVRHQRKLLEVKLGGALLDKARLMPTKILDSILEKHPNAVTKRGIDCDLVSQRLAITMLGTALFGDAFLAWPKAPLYEELLVKIAKDFCFWASYDVTPVWKRTYWQYMDCCTKLKSLTRELMKECRQSSKSEFLWDSDGHGKIGYESCGEVISLMFHGSLSMGALISNILTRLTTHQQIQEKIYSEIAMVKEVGRKPAQDVNMMPNLFATIYESLRLLPYGPLLQRCCLQHDLHLSNGMVIPAASIIVVPVQLVQMDSLYWGNDSGKFNPYRFLSVNDDKRELITVPDVSEAFLPFGSGARACIGQKLAIRAISSFFAALVENYEISLQPRSESNSEPGMNDIVLQLLPSPNVVFVKRST